MFRLILLPVLVALHATIVLADEPTITTAKSDPAGWIFHDVESEYQAGATQIRVLLPPDLKPDERLPVIYLLPVEAARESRYGDSLTEILSQQLHSKHRALYVAPTFSHLPWYADHPTDAEIRQESYLLKVVIPFIEEHYPAQKTPRGRKLLGFSKSGWGAWSLLLRHPETFGAAVAWDAPLMMDWPSKYGSQPIFGTEENFRCYGIASLLRSNADSLKAQTRLILLGYGGNGSSGFRQELLQTHELLNELEIPHYFADGPERKHDWHSGWLSEAIPPLLHAGE